jgi:branched-chain amino acid transport system ATP-binding protein
VISLQVENVSKSFSGIQALNDVSFVVEEGELSSIIGPNGAGKSTLFNVLTGEIKEDTGKVIFKGEDITDLTPHETCRRGIGRSFQLLNLFQQLTVYKNIQTAILAGRGLTANFLRPAKSMVRNEAEEILERVGLAEKANNITSEISYGEQRRLEFGIALANNPSIILLDEPTSGLSIEETRSMIDLIQILAKEQGLTLLVVEHKMDVIFSISVKIRVLYEGRIIFEGVPEEVKKSEEVQRVYLGEQE